MDKINPHREGLFTGSICLKYGFRIMSPGIGVFDYEEKSVVQLLDSGGFPGLSSPCFARPKIGKPSVIIYWKAPPPLARYYPVKSRELVRESVTLESSYGPLKAKQVYTRSGKTRMKAEYEAKQKLSEEAGVSPVQLKKDIESRFD